jgi:putative transposase
MPKKDTMVKALILQVFGTRHLGRDKVIPLVQRIEPRLSASKIRRIYKREGFSLQSRMRKSRVNNPANPIEIPLLKIIEDYDIFFLIQRIQNFPKCS